MEDTLSQALFMVGKWVEDIETRLRSVEGGSLMALAGGTLDNQVIKAGEEVRFIIPLDMPEGFTFGAYRQISIEEGSASKGTIRDCFIQWFSTTGYGKNAQIAVQNYGDKDQNVKVTVTALCYKS